MASLLEGCTGGLGLQNTVRAAVVGAIQRRTMGCSASCLASPRPTGHYNRQLQSKNTPLAIHNPHKTQPVWLFLYLMDINITAHTWRPC